MAKVTITPISSTISNTAANTINNNLNALADAIENTLSRDGTIPNQMGADIDLNNNDLLNVGLLDAQDVTFGDQSLVEIITEVEQLRDETQVFADIAEEAAQNAQTAAQTELAKAVRWDTAQTLGDSDKQQARENMGLGSMSTEDSSEYTKTIDLATVATSGQYSDLVGLPDLTLKEDKSSKGIANGYASLGSDGKVPSNQLPTQGAYLQAWDASTNTPTITAGVGNNGDFYSVSVSGTQSITGSPTLFNVGDEVRFSTTLGAWERIPNTQLVLDVAGKTGNVVLVKADVGLGNVDNTSDANKPISTATQTALDGKVPTTRTVAGKPLSSNVTLVKGDVGLGDVDNTSDANKPVSTATQTALNLKTNFLVNALSTTTAAPSGSYFTNGNLGYSRYFTGSTGFPSTSGVVWSLEDSTAGRSMDFAKSNTADADLYIRGWADVSTPSPWRKVLRDNDLGSTVAPLVGGLIPRQYIPSSVVTPEQFDANAGTGGNDNVALQAALDAGGIVLLTRPYITTTTLNVTQNGTTILGYGASISHNTSSLIDVMLIRERSNCNVFGLEINGRRDLKSASGQSNTRGITMYSCTNVNIKDCYIHDTLEHGIRTGNDGDTPVIISRHINIENNRVENCGNTTPRRGYGIWVFSENHDCKVIGNKVRNCVAGGIAADDVSDTQTTGLENERVIIGYNIVYNSAFDPNPGNSIGIWVGGSQNITVVGNNVRGYRNGIMLEDSQANSLNAWVTVTGNNVEAGPVGIMIRNSAFSVISGNTIKANKPPSGSFSGEATGILIYGYSEVAGPRRTHDILVQGNLIYTERRGISFVNPSYHTPVAGGVTGVSILGNKLIHFNTVNTNDNAIEINDGGVSNYVQDIVVEGNVADGFSIGYRYNASITNHGIFQRNTAQNCTVAGFNVTGNNQMLIGNTTRDNAVGILFSSANSATVVVKDHTFQSDSANTSGSNGSVTKINNYPSI